MGLVHMNFLLMWYIYTQPASDKSHKMETMFVLVPQIGRLWMTMNVKHEFLLIIGFILVKKNKLTLSERLTSNTPQILWTL